MAMFIHVYTLVHAEVKFNHLEQGGLGLGL